MLSKDGTEDTARKPDNQPDKKIYLLLSEQRVIFIKASSVDEALDEFALDWNVDYDLYSLAIKGCETLAQKTSMIYHFSGDRIRQIIEIGNCLYDTSSLIPEKSLLNLPWLYQGPVVLKSAISRI